MKLVSVYTVEKDSECSFYIIVFYLLVYEFK